MIPVKILIILISLQSSWDLLQQPTSPEEARNKWRHRHRMDVPCSQSQSRGLFPDTQNLFPGSLWRLSACRSLQVNHPWWHEGVGVVFSKRTEAGVPKRLQTGIRIFTKPGKWKGGRQENEPGKGPNTLRSSWCCPGVESPARLSCFLSHYWILRSND